MSAVLVNQLTYLLGTRRRLYRPLVWRSILPIKTGIPTWAENVSIYKVTENANEPVPHQIGNQKAPTPSIDRSAGTLKLTEFALAYQIWQADLDRKEATGIDIETSSVLANQRASEEFLNKVAALGYPSYGLPGLLNSAEVPIITITGAWTATTANQAVQLKDIGDTLFGVFENSKNLYTAKALLIPDNKWKILVETLNSFGVSTLELAQKMFPGVKFVPWFMLRTAGAASATRMVAIDNSEDVLSMLMVHELQDGKPLEVHGGFEVLQTVKTGGVLIEQPLAIAYADGV